MTTRTDYSGRWTSLLSWFLPVSYLIHIAEEYWGGEGYPAYLLRIRGVHLSSARFWVAQLFGVVLMITGIILARQLKFLFVMLVIIGSTITINGLTHALTAIRMGGYGPGLYSSLFLWIPLGLATVVYLKKGCIIWKYWIAIGIGVVINIVVDLVTLVAARLM